MSIFRISQIKNISVYFTASIITAAIGLLVNPLLAIGLSHEDYAIIGYYSSFGTLLTPIISFSLQSYYARNFFLVDDSYRKKMMECIYSIFFTISICSFVIFFILYYIYHHKYVSAITFSPYAILSFLPIYFSSFYNLYLTDLRLRSKSKKYAYIVIIQAILNAGISILLVYLIRWGALGRLLAILIVSIMSALYSVLINHCHFRWNWSIIKPALKFCWPLCIAGILSFFFLGIDRPMLAQLDNNHELGLYNVGLQISSYMAIVGTVLLQTFDPDIYKYTSLRMHKKVLLVVIGVVGACALANFCFIIISKPIIYLLTAGRYVDATGYANILCLKNISTTFAYVMSGVLIGYGFSKYELANRIIGAICSIGLYYFLINKWEFYGAAWGQCLSWIVMGLISLLSLLLIYKIRKNAAA